MALHRLQPVPVHRPWGGRRLARFCPGSPTPEQIGELYVHDGKTLPDVLVKWIDASDVLSVQNHPSAPGYSKNEAWYFVEAPDNGKVITGMTCALDDPDPRPHLAWTEVHTGDLLEVPAGCVHALTKGSLVVEIQEPLDVTYRIYDWGRGRELHLDEAARALSHAAPRKQSVSPAPGRHRLIDRSEFCLDVVNGPTATSVDRSTVAVFVAGNRFGENFLLCAGDKLAVEIGERVLFTAVRERATSGRTGQPGRPGLG